MDNSKQKPKQGKKISQVNVLESLKELGGTTAKSIKKDLFSGISQEFLKELLGTKKEKKLSGEIMPGEFVELDDVFAGKDEEIRLLKRQQSLERKLREEEKQRVEKRSNDLRLQLHALKQEVEALALSTQELAEETKVAAFQAPVAPGIYHVVFFEKLISFIRSFRESIDEAAVWLSSNNKRASKMNYWAKYKKHGSKFFLSGEHYLTRSAG